MERLDQNVHPVRRTVLVVVQHSHFAPRSFPDGAAQRFDRGGIRFRPLKDVPGNLAAKFIEPITAHARKRRIDGLNAPVQIGRHACGLAINAIEDLILERGTWLPEWRDRQTEIREGFFKIRRGPCHLGVRGGKLLKAGCSFFGQHAQDVQARLLFVLIFQHHHAVYGIHFQDQQVSEQETVDDRHIEIRTYFVRGRNALVARGDFSKIYVDYYLHLVDYDIRVDPDAADFAKNAATAVALHCASRPRNERIAWTVNFQEPLLNVFAAGDNPEGTIVVNVFTEDVRRAERSLFYADTIRGNEQPRRSVVDFEGSDLFSAAERYYAHSEQRPARFFHYGDDEYVLVGAQPDCDIPWLEGLDADAVRRLDAVEELALLEQRFYRFACGCNQSRIMRVIAPTYRMDPEALFAGDEVIRVGCPRCGARHAITREAMEAFATGAPEARA